jgi:hypothetical protein
MQAVDGDAANTTKSVTADRRFRIDVTPAWKERLASIGTRM